MLLLVCCLFCLVRLAKIYIRGGGGIVFGTCLYVRAVAFIIELQQILLWYNGSHGIDPIGTEDFFCYYLKSADNRQYLVCETQYIYFRIALDKNKNRRLLTKN